MKKIVVVSGASGFIGKNALNFLCSKGYEVHALSKSKKNEGACHWHQIDLLESKGFLQLFQEIRPTHLLHFAWETTHGAYWSSLNNLQWIAASINLVHAFLLSGGRRVVVAGSCAEYNWNQPCSEEANDFASATLYGRSKRALFLALQQLVPNLQFELAWGYLFHLYGPGESAHRFFPSVFNGLQKGISVPCSHGNQRRDFLYVKDAAEGFAELLNSPLVGAFNIASGEGISLRSFAEKVADLLGKERSLLHFGAVPSPKNDPLSLIADPEKWKSAFHWRPKYSLEEGLRETLTFLKKSDIYKNAPI